MQQKNVFISHVYEDDSQIQPLKNLLKKNGLEVSNYSITSDKANNAQNEDYIKNVKLSPRIKQCSVLVVYISKDTKNSKYVDWEIRKAYEEGKRIVGVWGQGEKNCELPENLEKYRDAMAGWNGNNIIDAINGNNSIQDSEGGGSLPNRDIPFHPCS